MNLTDSEIEDNLKAISYTRIKWKGAHFGTWNVPDMGHMIGVKMHDKLINEKKEPLGGYDDCPLCIAIRMNCAECVMQLHPDYGSGYDTSALCGPIYTRAKNSDNIEAAANEALDIVEAELRKL